MEIIKALEDWYAEYGRGRGLEYTYGYMDALAVVRAFAAVQSNGHHYSYTESDKAISDAVGHNATLL